MSKFKVGDRVRIVSQMDSYGYVWKRAVIGEIVTVDEITDTEIYILDKNKYRTNFTENMLELVKEAKPMSKYSELKAKIEALNNGWTKEADDVLKEIFHQNGGKSGEHYFLKIPVWNEKNADIGIIEQGDIKRCFHYHSQCEKNSAFKKALLWLLDHSEIKKQDHAEEIKSLREDIKKIEERIKELEQ